MAATAIQVSDTAAGLHTMAGVLVIRSLTIPGRPEHVRSARAFVAKALGRRNPLAEVAVLLTSELVTNAIMHSDSSCADGVVTLLVIEMRGGLRIEVADSGSALSIPVVKGEVYESQGHGLFLVQTMADQWGYVREGVGTTVWFWLDRQGPPP
jgi:anti-sigma regulatory factor (Ser/Thr protein kinase)